MKISLDLAKCQGYGICEAAEPQVFELGDNGEVVLLIDEPGEELRDGVARAVGDCPTNALSIADDS